ncbi:glycosyltransferase [Fibrobacterota bacterium]
MFISMMGLWKLWPDKKPILSLVLLAVIVRFAVVVQFPHGDDIHRYIWEGEIQLQGYNPFKLAPKCPELKHLRNENWKSINHKKLPTIYWPFSQILFKNTARISSSKTFFKTVFVLFDIGVIILLLFLCRNFGISSRHSLLYALNPFTIIFTAGDGHLEVVMVFWAVLAIYLLRTRRYALMYLSLGIAVMTKITPIIFLPFVIRRNNARFIFMLFIPLLLAIPYYRSDISFFAVPQHFLEVFRYNGLVYSLIRQLFDKHTSLHYCSFLMLFSFIAIFFLTPNPIKAMFLATAVFLTCTPTFHPWYMLLLTPFIVLYRPPPWILLHLSILPLIFVFNRDAPRPFWRDKTVMMVIEYTPFILAGIWYFLKGARHWPVRYPPPGKLSVIVPVYNEEKEIADCINSIQDQAVKSEILVVDCGSTDNTIEILKSFPSVKLLHSPPGRGIQIDTGLKQATGNIIAIVHADTRLKEGAFKQLLHELESNPEVSGGSFGAVYEDQRFNFRFTEVLNTIRAKFLGISFGDQLQFFRKEAIGNNFPAFKLMEDIELSYRLKEKGALVFIPKGVINSTRKWKQTGFIANFITIISLTSFYIIRRKFGLITKDCSDFYRLYYGKK